MKCERCGAVTEGYELHDYCVTCSKNLCKSCMDKGCCGNVPALSGMDSDELDDDTDAKEKPNV